MLNQEIHPDHDELCAFILGQLPLADVERLEQHVQSCESCCDTLETIAARDSFLEQLLLARGPQNACGDTSPNEIENTIDESIPDALANHPRYAVEKLVGRGGMGRVYKARHRLMDRAVAVKVIHREWVQNQGAIDRFRREVKTAASLDHRNVVSAYDAEQVENLHFLVMEYVDGIDLAQTVRNEGPLPVPVACDFIRQAAEGLHHAHELGMVHRDIKPHNLIVTNDGIVKILDFGLASLVSRSAEEDAMSGDANGNLTRVGAVMGTPDFISPEQTQDAREVDGRSDIYSLGMTLYFLLAGRVPFVTGTVAEKLVMHTAETPKALTSLREDVPTGLQAVVARMIAKDPIDRFQTPTEVSEELRPFTELSSQEVSSNAPSLRMFLSIALTCILVVVALSVFASIVNRTKKADETTATSTEEAAQLPTTRYDFSLVPETFVEILGGRPGDLLENDDFRDVWTILDSTPLKPYFDPQLAEGLCVTLPDSAGQVVILKTATVSAQEYAQKKLGATSEPLRESNIEVYPTDSSDKYVRLHGNDKLVVGTLQAITAHAECLNDEKPTFDPMAEQLQTQSAAAFKVSTSFSKESPRGSTDFWTQAYLNLLEFTMNPLLESDYLIASVDLQRGTSMVYLTAWCADSANQQIARRTMEAVKGVFPNLVQADTEGLFLEAHKQITDAVSTAEIVSLSDNCVRMEFRLQDAPAIRELIRIYFFISELGAPGRK